MRPRISVLLTTHKRPYLPQQLAAIRAQTISPERVMIWHDGPLPRPRRRAPIVASSHNLGVWPRFLFCMDFDTEYVCVFDDDTIPGPRWLENCVGHHGPARGADRHGGNHLSQGTRKNRQMYGWARAGRRSPPSTSSATLVLPPRLAALLRPGAEAQGDQDGRRRLPLQRVAAETLGAQQLRCSPPRPRSLALGLHRGHALRQRSQRAVPVHGEEEKKCIVHDFYRNGGWKLLCDLGDWEVLSRPDAEPHEQDCSTKVA